MDDVTRVPRSADVREEPFGFSASGPDWRIWFGLTVTAVWLLLLSLYVNNTIGWSRIGDAPIETLGGFLEGAFAPLAFLWLVIGYFLQKKELVQNTTAIKMQYVEIQKSADQAVIQSEAIRASELHARKESFLAIAESVKQQLGSIIGFLFISSQSTAGSGLVPESEISKLWGSMGQNDPEIFSRRMLELQYVTPKAYGYKLFYGTPVRTRHTENFITNFERLLNAAHECDADGMIHDAVLGSGHGHLYQLAIRVREEPPPGFTYGVFDFDPDTMDEHPEAATAQNA